MKRLPFGNITYKQKDTPAAAYSLLKLLWKLLDTIQVWDFLELKKALKIIKKYIRSSFFQSFVLITVFSEYI